MVRGGPVPWPRVWGPPLVVASLEWVGRSCTGLCSPVSIPTLMGFDGCDEARAHLEHSKALKGDPIPSSLPDTSVKICHCGTGNTFSWEQGTVHAICLGGLPSGASPMLPTPTPCPCCPLVPSNSLARRDAGSKARPPCGFSPVPGHGAAPQSATGLPQGVTADREGW